MEEPHEMMVLGAIRRGAKKFDKIKKETNLDPEEINTILERLEFKGMIQVYEKSGWLGKKVEMFVTDKGSEELDRQIHVMRGRWQQMSQEYESGNKKKLKGLMDDNKSILPMMLFFGVIDILMFSMMFNMMGMAMTDYVPPESMPEGMDNGMDDGGGDMGDGGGFDMDIGF